MEFITTDGKLIISNKTIQQKRIIGAYWRYFNLWLLSIISFSISLNTFIERLAIAQETGKTYKWAIVGLLGLLLLVFIVIIFGYLFRRSWKQKIDISYIEKIITFQTKKGLETNVEISFKNKQYKIYRFRTLEKQFNSFVETLRSINPNTRLETA